MNRKKVQEIDVTTDEQAISGQEEYDESTKEDDYEFLENIDFLKHVDLSDCEGDIFWVDNDAPEQEEIKVNVDYLDDLAFFDELDYFEQLNKSLEEELRQLDDRITTTKIKARRHFGRTRHDGLMLGVGIGVMVFLSAGVGTLVRNQVARSSQISMVANVNPVVEASAAPTAGVMTVSMVQTTNQTVVDNHKSESMIQKRKQPQAINTQIPKKEQAKEPSDDELKAFYGDSVFIGNSLVEALQVAGGESSAKYLAVKSLNVLDAMKKPFIGKSKRTIKEVLPEIQCNKVFVMFGVNELGWPYPKVFGDRYATLLASIKKLQPNATIYVQSILPCSKALAAQDKIYKKENIKQFNEAIQEAAKKTGCEYVEVGSSVTGRDGYLPEDAAVDGMHLKKAYNRKWITYLYQQVSR